MADKEAGKEDEWLEEVYRNVRSRKGFNGIAIVIERNTVYYCPFVMTVWRRDDLVENDE